MLAKEAMSRDVKLAHPDNTVLEAATTMSQFDIGMMPVVKDDKLAGTLTDRDIVTQCIAKQMDPAETKISDVMSDGVASCYDDQDINDVVNVMKTQKIRRVVVLNRDDKISGMISLGDVAGHLDSSKAGEIMEIVTEPPRFKS